MEERSSGKKGNGRVEFCWGTGGVAQRIIVRLKQWGLFPLVAHFFHFQVSGFEKIARNSGRPSDPNSLSWGPPSLFCNHTWSLLALL